MHKHSSGRRSLHQTRGIVGQKDCSTEGCPNIAQKGGVCVFYDGSMAFGSDDKTAATQSSLPKQRTFDASHDRSTGVPAEVIICQETEKCNAQNNLSFAKLVACICKFSLQAI